MLEEQDIFLKSSLGRYKNTQIKKILMLILSSFSTSLADLLLAILKKDKDFDAYHCYPQTRP
jgi:hypothetical protein